MNWAGDMIQNFVSQNDSVLDLGCGIRQALQGLIYKSYLGVDIWKPYLDHIKLSYPTILLDLIVDLDMFVDESFDVVLCLDLLEHLNEKDISFVLNHMKRICRKSVIILTPSTFDNNIESSKNAWGLGECEFQKHKCLVSLSQLESNGFSTTRFNIEDKGYFFAVFNK